MRTLILSILLLTASCTVEDFTGTTDSNYDYNYYENDWNYYYNNHRCLDYYYDGYYDWYMGWPC